MSDTDSKFFRDFFRNTNGFIPTQPLGLLIYPGDFFVIQNKKILRLGNIGEFELIDEPKYSEFIKLNPDMWQMRDGARQSYVSNEQTIFEGAAVDDRRKYVLGFDSPGSYIFHGREPRSQMILNFHHFHEALTIKMTQSEYMFREVYLATEVATLSSWMLAIADGHEAHFEVSSKSGEFGFFDFLVHESTITHRYKDMLVYHRHSKPDRTFFKGMKLTLREKKKEELIRHIMKRHCWPWNEENWQEENQPFHEIGKDQFLTNQMNIDLLNMADATRFNINTANEFFTWKDMSLNDVDKLTGAAYG